MNRYQTALGTVDRVRAGNQFNRLKRVLVEIGVDFTENVYEDGTLEIELPGEYHNCQLRFSADGKFKWQEVI